jgi:hypothetical protein
MHPGVYHNNGKGLAIDTTLFNKINHDNSQQLVYFSGYYMFWSSQDHHQVILQICM